MTLRLGHSGDVDDRADPGGCSVKRRSVREGCPYDLEGESVNPPGLHSFGTYDATHAIPLLDEMFSKVAADETCSARQENDVIFPKSLSHLELRLTFETV